MRHWYAIHRWTSLACSANLFVLCLTGLILIFHHEIDHLLGQDVQLVVPPGASRLPAEALVEAAQRAAPGMVAKTLSYSDDDPAMAYVGVAPPDKQELRGNRIFIANIFTGEVQPLAAPHETFTGFILKLHRDLFLDQVGQYVIGVLGLLFVISTGTGIALYAPFLKRLAFGAIRFGRGSRVVQGDMHNFFGVATLVWALTVGVTGTILSFDPIVLRVWQETELKEMVAQYRDRPASRQQTVDRALAVAAEAAPGRVPLVVLFPGTVYSGAQQYSVLMRGPGGIERNLLSIVMVDADTGRLTAARDMPWYIQALMLSGPFHFGDYGGLPLQILWALFTTVTGVVVVSGFIVWWKRRRRTQVDKAQPVAGGIPT